MPESVQSCFELSIHFANIFNSSSRLVCYTDKCMESSKQRLKMASKTVRRPIMVGYTYAEINMAFRDTRLYCYTLTKAYFFRRKVTLQKHLLLNWSMRHEFMNNTSKL